MIRQVLLSVDQAKCYRVVSRWNKIACQDKSDALVLVNNKHKGFVSLGKSEHGSLIQDQSQCIKGMNESTLGKDSLLHLMHSNPIVEAFYRQRWSTCH